MKIPKPTTDIRNASYQVECEEALAPLLRDVADQAISAGWSADAVYSAMGSVVKHQQRLYSTHN